VARGIDPRDHLLVAFGGAGPLHAVDLARQLGTDKVLIPATPGTLCALGLLVSDLQTEFTQTRLIDVTAAHLPAINDVWAELNTQALAWIDTQEHPGERDLSHRADVRYRGQDHSLTVTVPAAPWTPAHVEDVLTAFRREHLVRNGYAAENEAIEIENFRIVPRIRVGGAAPDAAPGVAVMSRVAPPEAKETTEIRWSTGSEDPTPVFHRADLPAGSELLGPALVLQEDTTLVVPPGASVAVQPDGSLVCRSWALDDVDAAAPADDVVAGAR
jgi:N-methylhydantoinase A